VFKPPRICRVNENSVIIYFSNQLSNTLPSIIAEYRKKILKEFGRSILDTVPAYTSLLITFDDKRISFSPFHKNLDSLLNNTEIELVCKTAKKLEIPVLYTPEAGLDLLSLSEAKQLSIEEIVTLHTAVRYKVYAVGFCPGFAYMGDIHNSLEQPRLQSPRTQVPAGSVGIAENQTCIYPTTIPGGWNILGKTPLRFFKPSTQTCALSTGDEVCFCPIEQESSKY